MEAAAVLPQEDMAVTRAARAGSARAEAEVAEVAEGVPGKMRLFHQRRR